VHTEFNTRAVGVLLNDFALAGASNRSRQWAAVRVEQIAYHRQSFCRKMAFTCQFVAVEFLTTGFPTWMALGK